jgi:hypothetical protein
MAYTYTEENRLMYNQEKEALHCSVFMQRIEFHLGGYS